jgi:hypothetical protein
MQLYRSFVSQSSEFCRHNLLCSFSTSVYCCKHIFRYRLSPETFGYTLVYYLLLLLLLYITKFFKFTYMTSIGRITENDEMKSMWTYPLHILSCHLSRYSDYVTGWTIGVLGFDSRLGLGISLFTIVSRMALRPTQPPIQWVPGTFSRGVKRPGREAHHSPPSSAEIKNPWIFTSTPPIRLHGVVLS